MYQNARQRLFSLVVLLGIAGVLGLVPSSQAQADGTQPQQVTINRIIYISPVGDDKAAGTEDAPRRSVQKAIDEVGPGDVVRLMPGVHRERVTFKRNGEFGKPVVLEGMDGAVLDGSNVFEPKWTSADDVAPGVYRSAVPFRVRTVFVDGKLLLMLNEPRVNGSQIEDEKYQWKNLFRDGIRGRWSGVRGIGYYNTNDKQLYVRFENNADPRSMTFNLAPEAPVVKIAGVDRCVVRNLTIRYALYGVWIDHSLGSVVELCRINPTDHGVWLDEGSDRCTVRFNEITQNPLGEYRSDAAEVKDLSWDTWLAQKDAGYWDSMAIQIERTMGGHQIHDNNIHNHWDGIQDIHWEKWKTTAAERLEWAHFNQNLNVHHNRIELTNDDALEPNGGEINAQWHDNLVINTRCGLRIKVVDVGPMYVYGNMFVNNREDIRFFGSMELNPAVVYIYHNSSTTSAAINSNKVQSIGTPNYHVYNNLFWATHWWHNNNSDDPNWHGDYNVYVRRDNDKRWDEGEALAHKLGMDAHSRWITGGRSPYTSVADNDLSLAQDSPARHAGTDLAGTLGESLPGLDKYADATPDAGAIPFGQPMPQIPRDPATVDMIPAGLWPEPD